MSGTHANRKRWGALLALFALYLQIFVPISLATSAVRSGDDSFSSRTIICTEYGSKLVDLSTGKEVPSHSEQTDNCPICLSFQLGTAVLDNSSKPVIVAPVTSNKKREVAYYTEAAKLAAPSDCLSRSPPIRL